MWRASIATGAMGAVSQPKPIAEQRGVFRSGARGGQLRAALLFTKSPPRTQSNRSSMGFWSPTIRLTPTETLQF
jgi:hypothetical protein